MLGRHARFSADTSSAVMGCCRPETLPLYVQDAQEEAAGMLPPAYVFMAHAHNGLRPRATAEACLDNCGGYQDIGVSRSKGIQRSSLFLRAQTAMQQPIADMRTHDASFCQPPVLLFRCLQAIHRTQERLGLKEVMPDVAIAY